MAELKVLLAEDKRIATLLWTGPPGPIASLNADDIEELILKLSALRMRMVPSTPTTMQAGTKFKGVLEPKAIVEPEVTANGVLLHVRHPGMGWLHFAFKPKTAKGIVRAMTTILGRRAGPNSPLH